MPSPPTSSGPRALRPRAGTGNATRYDCDFTDDVSWQPAREGAWKACVDADEVLSTLLWRAGMNKIRPADTIDLGDRVVVQLRGRGMDRLGAKGLFPRLFQIVVFREGRWRASRTIRAVRTRSQPRA